MARWTIACWLTLATLAGCTATTRPGALRGEATGLRVVDEAGVLDAIDLTEVTADYAAAVPPTSDGVAEVRVFPNRRAWAAAAEQVEGAKAWRGIDRGGFERDGVAYVQFVGDHDTRRLVRHEGFHAWASVHRGENRPPAFVEEGLAAWMENGGRPQPHRLALLEAAGDVPYGELAKLAASDLVDRPAAAQLYYAAAWAVADYLMTHRRAAVRAGDYSFDPAAVTRHVAALR